MFVFDISSFQEFKQWSESVEGTLSDLLNEGRFTKGRSTGSLSSSQQQEIVAWGETMQTKYPKVEIRFTVTTSGWSFTFIPRISKKEAKVRKWMKKSNTRKKPDNSSQPIPKAIVNGEVRSKADGFAVQELRDVLS